MKSQQDFFETTTYVVPIGSLQFITKKISICKRAVIRIFSQLGNKTYDDFG